MTARPRALIAAAALQLLLAATFLTGFVVVLASGAHAQAAAEAELTRQGLPPGVLAAHGVRFDDSGVPQRALALVIALVLTALALLNLAGNRLGRLLSWVCHPVLIVAGGVIIPAQVFTTRVLTAAFRDSGDPVLRRVDVPALVAAAARAYPGWLPTVDLAKLVLATAGSLAVVVLLALPASRPWFRGRADDQASVG
jgi:hypothetical protein